MQHGPRLQIRQPLRRRSLHRALVGMPDIISSARHFIIRLPRKADIIDYLTRFCEKNRIFLGSIQLIGATSVATIGYYDQKTHEYAKTTFREEMEIVSCSGNVSLKEGKPFLHLHAVLGDTKLRCYGGHVFPGSEIFAAEAHIQELTGAERTRLPDNETGLALWCGAA